MHRTIACAGLAVACLLGAPVARAAQGVNDFGAGPQATRGELEARVRQLEHLVRSGAAEARQLSPAHAAIASIRVRLVEGDFQVGDRIAIAVDGDTAGRGARSVEQQLSDTFTVGPGMTLRLPVVGVVALRGVLRSELEGQLAREVGRVIRDPLLRAKTVLRLSVQGGVARPGYYSLPTDAAVSDALMAAGGPAPEAKIGKLRIERDGRAIWEGERLQRAIAAGQSLEAIGLRAGDEVVVPRKGGTERTLRILAIVVSIPTAIYTLTRF
ncbi:MAG TPA: SLBB domain-containing protein [Gemmatimonadales bacterium]